MEVPINWVWDRPLTPDSDMNIWISRISDVKRFSTLIENGKNPIFAWSPPKSGTSTFFNEVAAVLNEQGVWEVNIIPASSLISSLDAPALAKDSSRHLVIIDELEDLSDSSELKNIICSLFNDLREDGHPLLVLAGDHRTLNIAKDLWGSSSIVEFQLESLDIEDIAQRLVINPLKSYGLKVQYEAAKDLCSTVGGNLYLIQFLADKFRKSICDLRKETYDEAEMEVFLVNAPNYLVDYFDELVSRVLIDEEAPYAIITLLEGNLKEESLVVKGLGITKPNGLEFASKLFRDECRNRCNPLKLAQSIGAKWDLMRAVELYEVFISRWSKSQEEKENALKEVLNKCYLAAEPLKYTSFASQLSRMMPITSRREWLSGTFKREILRLLDKLSDATTDVIFDTVIQAVDTISGTGRVRLYLTDATEQRLICRAAIGQGSQDFKQLPIPVDAEDWKVAFVYRTPEFTDIIDTKRDDETRKEIVSRYKVLSAWLIPIMIHRSNDNMVANSPKCIGILCVDNPHHHPNQPAEEEKNFIEEILVRVAQILELAKDKASRSDLQFRVERLTSIHKYLLTDHPAEDILDQLFEITTDIQPNLSMINVRLLQGYHSNRLGVARFWPKEKLEPIFAQPELNNIPLAESFGEPENRESIREIYDVIGDTRGRDKIIALGRFIKAVEEAGIDLPLGSLISFRLETEHKYFGMCNFYTVDRYKFADDEKAALSMVVKQAAMALYNSQYVKATKRQQRGLQILNDCIAFVNRKATQLDPNVVQSKLLRDITSRLGELFEAQSASFISVDNNKRVLNVQYTWPEEFIIGDKKIDIEWGKGITGLAIDTGKPQVFSIKDPEWGNLYIERVPDIKTSAVIPMRDQNGMIIGALALETYAEDSFTQDDIILIDAIVSQVDIAITNARLVASLSLANQQLNDKRWTEVMGESVGHTVHRVANVGGSIPGCAEETRQLILLNKEKGIEHFSQIINNLEEIERDGQKLLGIARQLKASMDEPLLFSEFCLSQLARDTIDEYREFDIEWKFSGEKNLIMISDKDKVQEILRCLFENATKATIIACEKDPERSPIIEVTIAKDMMDMCLLYVQDVGNGIPPDYKKELCTTVVRSNWSGSGIGLFVSNQTARRLGGKITLEKTKLSGSLFLLTLQCVSKFERKD